MSAPLIDTDFGVPDITDADDSRSSSATVTAIRIRIPKDNDQFVVRELTGASSGTAAVDWGDGSTATTVTFGSDGKYSNLSHYYGSAGWYVVSFSDGVHTLKVVDASSADDPWSPGGSSWFWPPVSYSRDYASMIRDILSVAPHFTGFADGCFEKCRCLTPALLARVPGPISFGRRAFSKCTGLVEILHHENSPVITPGVGTFSMCTSLGSLTGLSGLTTCPAECFRGCTSLNVSAPPAGWATGHDGKFGSRCFADCTSMTGTGILSGTYVRELGTYIFQGCTSLANVVPYADAVASATAWTDRTEIPEGMFDGCTGLTTLAGFAGTGTAPGFTEIGARCFRGCTGLTLFNFPDSGASLETVGDGAFDGCTALASFSSSPQHVTSFGARCFRGCSALQNLTGISAALTSLGAGCFEGCSKDTFDADGHLTARTGLSDVSALADTEITSLPTECFLDCRALADTSLIALSSSVATAGSACFKGCVSVSRAPNIRSDTADSLFEGCADSYKVRDEGETSDTTVFSGIVDASRVSFSTAFPDAAFKGCEYLVTAPTVHATVASLGDECFRGCANLANLPAAGSSRISFGERCFADCVWAKKDSAGFDVANPLKAVVDGTELYRYSGEQSALPSSSAGLGGLTGLGGIETRLKKWFLTMMSDGTMFGGASTGALQTQVENLFDTALDILGDSVRYYRQYNSLRIAMTSVCGSAVATVFGEVTQSFVKDYLNTLLGTAANDDYNAFAMFYGSQYSGTMSVSRYTSAGKLSGRLHLFALTSSVRSYTTLTSHLLDEVSFSIGAGETADVSESFDYTRTEGGSSVTDSSKIVMSVQSVDIDRTDASATAVTLKLTWGYTKNQTTVEIASWTIAVSDFYRLDEVTFGEIGCAGAVARCVQLLILSGVTKDHDDYDGGSYYISLSELTGLLGDVFDSDSFTEAVLANFNKGRVFPSYIDDTFGKYCFENSSKFSLPSTCWLPGMTEVHDGLLKGTATSSLNAFVGASAFGRYSFADTGVSELSYWPMEFTVIPDGLFSGCSSLGSLDGMPNTVEYFGESCFEDSGLMQLDHYPCDGDSQTALSTKSLKEDAFRAQLCTTIPPRAFAGTSIESLTYDVTNSLDPDSIYNFGKTVFNSWCKITVDMIHTSGSVYATRPVLRIRPNRYSPMNRREILVSVDYSDVTATCTGKDYSGNDVSNCLSGATFGVYTSSGKTVTNYEQSGSSWSSRDRYYHRMETSTGHFYGNSWDEMVKLSYVSAGSDGVVFTCGPYQFTVKFWIVPTLATDSATGNRYATNFTVKGVEITDVTVRSGYDAAAHSLPYFPLVTSIGEAAFADCDALTDVWWPSSLTALTNDVFRGCANLDDLATLPATVTSYGTRSFAGCPFGALSPIVPTPSLVAAFPAMLAYKTAKDAVAAEIAEDVVFYNPYGNFEYGSNRQIRFAAPGKTWSAMTAGEFVMGWVQINAYSDGAGTTGYTAALNSFSASDSYNKVPGVTAEGVTGPFAFSVCPSPDYGTGTGSFAHSFRGSFNGSLYNVVMKFDPKITYSTSTTVAASLDRIEFSTDDTYEEMKKILAAVSAMRADRASSTSCIFYLRSSGLVNASGGEISWAAVAYDTTTGEWGNLYNVATNTLGYAAADTTIRIGYPVLQPAGSDGTRHTLEFTCTGSHGTWTVSVAFSCNRVIIRRNALEIPSTVTSIGKDCFSFDEYPGADPKLGNLTFLDRTVAQIQALSNFPWGVPDGCTITDSSGNIAYYQEPEDG